MQSASTAQTLKPAHPNRHHLTEFDLIELQCREWEDEQLYAGSLGLPRSCDQFGGGA